MEARSAAWVTIFIPLACVQCYQHVTMLKYARFDRLANIQINVVLDRIIVLICDDPIIRSSSNFIMLFDFSSSCNHHDLEF